MNKEELENYARIAEIPGSNIANRYGRMPEYELPGRTCGSCGRTLVMRRSFPGEECNPGIYCPVCDY